MRIRQLAFLVVLAFSGYGQYVQPEPGKVFADDEVPRIDIFIDDEDLDKILMDVESDVEYPATFVFSSSELVDTIEEVGVRLRGNTSRHSAKKSIKLSFNTFRPGRKFKGLEKMNLNGEHNDPTILRAKMCWDLCHFLDIPASRSNHVALYVNSEYGGLYLNVEHIDEEFVQKRFIGGSGNLYKCLYPATLEYKGNNPVLYKEEIFGRRAYDLKTNKERDNYSDLAHFIDVLNNYSGEAFQCELEKVFDVDTYLKTIVMDVLTSNWDGPIINKNNFYLYSDSRTGMITYLPYDLDNTFGIDWFRVDWAQTEMYNWTNVIDEARPIYDNILAVKEYRDRYTFYMQKAIEKYFNLINLFPYIEAKRELIKSFRVDDPRAGLDYGWDYNDFLRSFDEPLGAHVKNGLVDYISQRVESIETQLETIDVVPQLYHDPQVSADEVHFEVKVVDESTDLSVALYYSINGGPWLEESLAIDAMGMGQLDLPYTEVGIMQYYFEVTDAGGQSRNYPLCQDAEIQLGYNPVANVVINEFMASNDAHIADGNGEYDDWIELYNAGTTTANIFNYYLSDDPSDPTKWQMPGTVLHPGKYLIIWADGDSHQGAHHANFKLSKDGEFLGLFDGPDNNSAVIDSLTFPPQETDRSYARMPNGTGDFFITDRITFDYNNDEYSSVSVTEPDKILLYPNPTSDLLYLGYGERMYDLFCYSVSGEYLFSKKDVKWIDVSDLATGLYYLRFSNGQRAKFSVIK